MKKKNVGTVDMRLKQLTIMTDISIIKIVVVSRKEIELEMPK
jgi:hypothetical protein